jgi:hypothetical protein
MAASVAIIAVILESVMVERPAVVVPTMIGRDDERGTTRKRGMSFEVVPELSDERVGVADGSEIGIPVAAVAAPIHVGQIDQR